MKPAVFLFVFSIVMSVVVVYAKSVGTLQTVAPILAVVIVASLILGYIKLVTFMHKAKIASRKS